MPTMGKAPSEGDAGAFSNARDVLRLGSAARRLEAARRTVLVSFFLRICFPQTSLVRPPGHPHLLLRDQLAPQARRAFPRRTNRLCSKRSILAYGRGRKPCFLTMFSHLPGPRRIPLPPPKLRADA